MFPPRASLIVSLLLVSGAASAAAGDNATAPAAGYSLYERLSLGGPMHGIVRLRCKLTCSASWADGTFAGPAGSLEVWQDERITTALRTRLWGRKGAGLTFAGRTAKPALILLRDAHGEAITQAPTDGPLIDLQPLLLGTAAPQFLLSVQYPVAQAGAVAIVRALLTVDLAHRQMGFASFDGPASAPITLTNGQTLSRPIPGGTGPLTLNGAFTLQANPSGDGASITTSACVPDHYVDYRTRASINTILLAHVTYELRDNAWHRTAHLEYAPLGRATAAGESIPGCN